MKTSLRETVPHSLRPRAVRWVAAAIGLCGLLAADHSVRAADADAPAMEVRIDPDTKVRRVVFNRVDRAVANNGKVYLSHPNWARMAGVVRGTPLSKVGKFIHVSPDLPGGGTTIPLTRIESLTWYEEMLTEKFYEFEKVERLENATDALEELKRFNKDWKPSEVARMERALAFLSAREKFAAGATDIMKEDGLKELDRLAAADAAFPGLKAVYLQRFLQKVEASRTATNWDKARQYLDMIEARYPKTADAGRIRDALIDESRKLLAEASENAGRGKSREAHDLALSAMARWTSPDLQREAAKYLAAYPIVKVASYETASALDPFNAAVPLERQLLTLLFDRLVEPNETGMQFAAGPLVDQLEIRNLGREIRLELRSGLRFSDGTPLSGHDVVNSVELMTTSPGAGLDPESLRYLRGARVDPSDPNIVTIELEQHPRPESLLTLFVTPSKHLPATPRPGDPFSRQPIGSGPFIVPPGGGRVTRLIANPRFRGAPKGQPYVKEQVFPLYTSQAAGAPMNDLQRGDVHLLVNPSPTQLVQLQNQAKLFRTRPFLSNSVYVLLLNHRRPLFQRKDVREALLLGIDRQRILDQHFAGGGNNGFAHSVVSGPFPPQSPAADPSLKPVEPNLILARDRFAGIPAGELREISLKAPIGDDATELAVQQIRKDLEAVGFKIRTETKAPNDLVNEVAGKHDYDMAYWRIDHVNVLFNIAGMFDGSEAGMKSPGGTNITGYSNQRLTQLFVDLRQERNDALLWKAQHRIHRFFYNEVVFVPLWRLDNFVVYTQRLTGRSAAGGATELPLDGSHLFRRPEEWYLAPAFEK